MVVIAAALVVGVLLQREAAAQRAPSPQPAQSRFPASAFPRFEYATLRYDMPSDRWTWTTPDDVKRGDKRRLFREMDGSFKSGDNSFNATNDGIGYGKLDAVVPADAKAAADKALADIKSGAVKPKTDLTVK